MLCSMGQMGTEGEAPVSSRVATGEGHIRHCSLRCWHRSPGQEGLQGCLPAACPPWEFEDRYRRLGKRTGLRERSEHGGISKIPPDKAQGLRACSVPARRSQDSPMCSWVTPNKHTCSPLCCHHVTLQSPEMSLEGDVSAASPATCQAALPEEWD